MLSLDGAPIDKGNCFILNLFLRCVLYGVSYAFITSCISCSLVVDDVVGNSATERFSHI